MGDTGVPWSISGPARVRIRTAPVTDHWPAGAVLDQVEVLLRTRGWCQGRAIDRSGRLSLEAAVDEAAAMIASDERSRVVLAARTRNRLSRCAGVAALTAWNDEQSRRIADVMELIALARFTAI